MVRFSPFRTIPFIRHYFSLTLAISLSLYFFYSPVSLWPSPFLSCFRWWQVIRYLQAGSRERWKRTRWALLSTTEENHPQAYRILPTTRSRTQAREPPAANELSNFANSFYRFFLFTRVKNMQNAPDNCTFVYPRFHRPLTAFERNLPVGQFLVLSRYWNGFLSQYWNWFVALSSTEIDFYRLFRGQK